MVERFQDHIQSKPGLDICTIALASSFTGFSFDKLPARINSWLFRPSNRKLVTIDL
jgi:hypothetical protein